MMNRDGNQQGYYYSRLWLNQYLREIDHWNLETLKTRYKMLLDRFFEIWNYPDVEVEEDFDADNEYTIYNAPEPKNRKLDYFIFRDEKVVEAEVSKMYYHVIKSLFEDNPSAFQHHDVKSLIQLATNPSEARSPFPISPSYYIESNIDSNTKFRRLKLLLNKFDCEEELLIKFADEGHGNGGEVNEGTWQTKEGEKSMSILKDYASLLKQIDSSLGLNYTVGYVGVGDFKRAQNFVLFNPSNKFVKVAIQVPEAQAWVKRLEKEGIEFLSISKRTGRLKFRLPVRGGTDHKSFLNEIFSAAYQAWKK